MNRDAIAAIESLRLKFTSGNSVPVDRATITRAEFEAIAALQQPSAQEAVAYCDPSDPINSTAFAWPGSDRDVARHRTALYPAPTLRPVSDEDVALARQASDLIHVSRGASYETDDAAIRAALESFIARREAK